MRRSKVTLAHQGEQWHPYRVTLTLGLSSKLRATAMDQNFKQRDYPSFSGVPAAYCNTIFIAFTASTHLSISLFMNRVISSGVIGLV
jgi:hypothetical protein